MTDADGPHLKALREGEALLALLRRNTGVVPAPRTGADEPPPADNILRAAQYHGVMPVALTALKRAAAPVSDAWLTRGLQARATALRMAVTAPDIGSQLDAAGISYVVFKGPVIALAYPRQDRSFSDVDILVAPADMPAAITALEGMGATVLGSERWPRSDGVGELSLGLPSGVSIDLHGDLIHHARIRRDFNWPAEPLLARSVTVDLHGRSIRAMEPEDHLIYVALHAMLSGGHRLNWIVDLDALIRAGALDWDLLTDRAAGSDLALVVGVMLTRARDLLGTPVPADQLRRLVRRGRIWNQFLRQLNRSRPIAACHGPGQTGQFFVRATRASTLRSLVALVALVRSEVLPARRARRAHSQAMAAHRDAATAPSSDRNHV